MKNLNLWWILAGAIILVAGCSTRIYQQAGGNADVRISTSTAVQPASAVGNNPVASVAATRIESR